MIYVLTAVLAILKLAVLPEISWWLVFTPLITGWVIVGILACIAFKCGMRLK